jgi:hypothetical protein
MIIFHRTAEFDAWLSDLKDKIGKNGVPHEKD